LVNKFHLRAAASVLLILVMAACGKQTRYPGGTPAGELAVTIKTEHSTVQAGKDLALTAETSGATDDALFTWDATAGEFSEANAQETVWTAPAEPGAVTVTVTVASAGRTADDELELEVTAEPEPVAPLEVSIEPPATTAVIGGQVKLELTINEPWNSDPDLSVDWTAPAYSDFSSEGAHGSTWSAPLEPGTYELQAKVMVDRADGP